MRREIGIHEERLAPSRRIRPRDRMRDRRMLGVHGLLTILHPDRLEAFGREVLRKRVHRAEPGYELSQRFGESLVRQIHVGPQRVAAQRRNLLRVEQRGLRRFLEIRYVVMPSVGAGAARRIVFEYHDLACFALPRIEWMNVQLAEARGEITLLRRRERLSWKEEHEPVVERCADF